MKPPLAQGRADDFQTPPEALEPLLPYVPRSWVVWEPAVGLGLLARGLEERGYTVIASDILDGRDFRLWEPAESWDCIVTNPPYSLKQAFLERCYLLGKPWALLLPLTTFETQRRQALFRRHGIQVLFLPRRVNFHTPSGNGSGAWFAVAWFTWRILPKSLVFPREALRWGRRSLKVWERKKEG